ncbi:DUF1684 domain-containing protein [Parapedobacter pyrenivorans]|uniref:DUF1684 domain-containing protein n=1 Tax=Parapedobacter pyrenivorans TaxID=1305674 RepID=UPI003341718B
MKRIFDLRLKGLLYAVCCFILIAPSQAQTYRDSLLASRQAKLDHFAKDPTAPLKQTDIQYLHHYEPDSGYRVQATIELLLNELPFRMPTSDGTSKEYIRYAKARFSIDGEASELTIYRSTDLFVSPAYRNHLFLPFTDETNGGETYGGGRYIDLSVTDIHDGRIAIDFNTAYNPYCAYSGGYRCPVPPAENQLPIAIKAGEKNYTGPIRQRPQPSVPPKPLTEAERDLILAGDTAQLLRVIQDTVAAETRILRSLSNDIDPKDALLPLLANRMFLAVTDSLHPGVGIAAPQVGINRNVIWVQRFDKPDEPLELYLNPKITWRSKLLRKGLEGCLSIPDTMGQVLRNYTIRLSYQDIAGTHHEEMIEGFTAVIFQHETDHLYGILFTDRLAEQEANAYHLINAEVQLYLEQRLRRQ